MEELLITHLTRKNVDTNCLSFQKSESSSGNKIRQKVIVKQGIDREISQTIIKAIKNSKKSGNHIWSVRENPDPEFRKIFWQFFSLFICEHF